MTPAISVIIPTCNRPEQLTALLDSLKSQAGATDISWELIIVDDASTSEVRQVYRRYLGAWKASPLQFCPIKTRSGVSRARNTGVKQSRGNILVFLDDDMVVDSRFLEETLHIHTDYPDILVVNGLLRKTRDDFLSEFWHYYYSAVFNKPLQSPYRVCRLASGHFSMKRKLLETVSPLFDEALPSREDLDLYLRLRAANIPAYKDDRIIAYHDFRQTLLSLIRQRLWYEKGETMLRRKYGTREIRAFYQSEPRIARNRRFLPLNLALFIIRHVYRLSMWRWPSW